jgi:hypothetical protein
MQAKVMTLQYFKYHPVSASALRNQPVDKLDAQTRDSDEIGLLIAHQ